ncbi:NERD domain-containing protein [Streptomyces sp. NBC_01221]|uniref:nuclease-related domain-containing protein n=1 Tax=Streptomyces sp. NBC_01221 TaxID=2903782 RepID=UPI00224CCB63|nr:nuclease-related domain-containing protein [Streptomyces sp. NBC_01221]MCX4792543.1 NERD domain-containing protein [Streptomyces sp. NBC_01221]
MSTQNSAAARAAVLRRRARRALWRRLLALCGVRTAAMRRADASAARWEHGAAGEETTVRMLAALKARGWVIRHDLRLRGRRFNVDHVLCSPCGTAVVVLDTKSWHRGRPTSLIRGRVCCGTEDRHEQVEKVAKYARLVEAALELPGVAVWPLLVVHGSPVAGGQLEARVQGWDGPVYVLSPDRLVPRLAGAPKVRDPRRAALVAQRVDSVLLPYTETA